MKDRKRLLGAGLMSVSLLAAGCGTQTMLQTTWSLPGVLPEPSKKVAVVAVMKNKDESTAFETAVVSLFAKDGIDAVPGFSFLNGKTDLSQDQLEAKVRGTGADGVLCFKVIAVDRYHSYVPPTAYVTDGADYPDWWSDPYWGYYNPYPYHYWGFWYPGVQVAMSPAYWQTHHTYVVQSAYYRVSDGKLVWTATSDTFDPTGQVDLGKSVAKPVIEDLEDRGLIQVR